MTNESGHPAEPSQPATTTEETRDLETLTDDELKSAAEAKGIAIEQAEGEPFPRGQVIAALAVDIDENAGGSPGAGGDSSGDDPPDGLEDKTDAELADIAAEIGLAPAAEGATREDTIETIRAKRAELAQA